MRAYKITPGPQHSGSCDYDDTTMPVPKPYWK